MGGELVLVSACLTVTPLITDGPEHTRQRELAATVARMLGVNILF